MTYLNFGLDIGKTSFSFVGLHADRSVAIKKTLNRKLLFKFFQDRADAGESLPIAMEACCSSYWLAEQFEAMGHEVKLLHARYVKPFATARQKNDERDALAIAKASLDPTIRPVPIQRAEQRAVLNLHRVRERLVRQRTALVCQMRSLLWEEGLTPRTGRKWFERHIRAYLDEHRDRLHPAILSLMNALTLELRDLSDQIEGIETEIQGAVQDLPAAKRLLTIPGIGIMNATALAAQVGDANRFASGRDMAAWLGLVPRQVTTGGKQSLRGITRAGNGYLRKLLIHGARSLLAFTRATDHAMVRWAQGLIERGMCRAKAAVALANKLARLSWAVMARNTGYVPQGTSA